MPASPVMNTTWPSPAFTALKRSRSSPSSRSRPTRGVRPRSTATSKRVRRPRGRRTSKACTKGVHWSPPLHRHLAQIARLEEAGYLLVRRGTDDHVPRLGHLLEPCCQVRGITHRGVV